MTVTFHPISYPTFRAELPKNPDPSDLTCYICKTDFDQNDRLIGHQGIGTTRHVSHEECQRKNIAQKESHHAETRCDFCRLKILNATDYLPSPSWKERFFSPVKYTHLHAAITGAVSQTLSVAGSYYLTKMVVNTEDPSQIGQAMAVSVLTPILVGALCGRTLCSLIRKRTTRNPLFFGGVIFSTMGAQYSLIFGKEPNAPLLTAQTLGSLPITAAAILRELEDVFL